MIQKYLSIFLLLSLNTLFASNAVFKSNESFTVAAADSLQGDLFYGGRYLRVEGSVKGDVIAGAQDIYVSGYVDDDVYAWGEIVRIEGMVGDVLLGFGKEVIITGIVRGDLIAYGGSVRVLSGAEIMGNVYVGTGYFSLQKAKIHGDIYGGAGIVHLNGKVGGDIDLSTGKIDFGKQFSSRGKVEIELNEEPQEPLPNAPANLKITIEPEEYFYQEGYFYYFLAVAFVIGIILLAVFPNLKENLTLYSENKPGAVFLTGTIFIVGMPLLMIFALMLLPLAFIFTAFYLSIMYLSKIFASFVLGDLFFKRVLGKESINPYFSFIIALVVLTLLIKIPFGGFIIWLLTFVIGSGAFIYYLYSLRKNGKGTTA